MECDILNNVNRLSFHGKNNADILNDLFSIAENVHKGSAEVSVSELNFDVQYKITSSAKEPILILRTNKAECYNFNDLSTQSCDNVLDNLLLLIKNIVMGFAFTSARSALQHEIYAPFQQIFALISYDMLKIDESQLLSQGKNESEDMDHENITDTISENPEISPNKIGFIEMFMQQEMTYGSPKREYKKYPCRYCEKNFCNIEEKELHEYTHLKERPFLCTFCKKAFTTKGSRDIHESTHADEKVHACTYCGKKFTLMAYKQAHELSYCPQNEERKSTEKLTADYRDKVYRQIRVREHLYYCRYCSIGFTCDSKRQMHEQTHSSSHRYECNYCEKTFFYKGETQSHMRFHRLQLKSSHCSVCKKCLSNCDIVNICNRHPIVSCRDDFGESSGSLSHDRKSRIKTAYVCKYCSKFCEVIKYKVNSSDEPIDFVKLNLNKKGFKEKIPTQIIENGFFLPLSNVAISFDN